MATHADRILAFVQQHPGQDDDEISRALDIRPRQTVNLACRRLERRGELVRRVGDNGKIASFPNGGSAFSGAQIAAPDVEGQATPLRARRPLLTSEDLLKAGFARSAHWVLVGPGQMRTDTPLPRARGVYAFVMDDLAQYVGVATMGLAKRLRFYAKPGATQRTSQRLNALLLQLLQDGQRVEIYTAHPENLSWNGLPVSGDAGLELGLIETYDLPWNVRGTH